MKKTLILALLILITLAAAPVRSEDGSIAESYEQTLTLRIKALEAKHRIKFNPDWRPRVSFNIPDSIPPETRDFWFGMYDVKNQSFVFHPRYRQKISAPETFAANTYINRQVWLQSTFIAPSFDHELGHALADQISRRHGQGEWPKTAGFENLRRDQKIGLNILVEGIGTYFEMTTVLDKPICRADFWPEHIDNIIWQNHLEAIFYHGGYCVVEPIISQFGEAGVLYLVTKPLEFKDGLIQKGVERYQTEALCRLSGQQK